MAPLIGLLDCLPHQVRAEAAERHASAHHGALLSPQDRLSDAEAVRTSAELRLASAEAARAAAVTEALSRQSRRHEQALEQVRVHAC